MISYSEAPFTEICVSVPSSGGDDSFLFHLVLLVSVKVVCCPVELVYIDSGTKLTVLVSKMLSNLWLHVCLFVSHVSFSPPT